MRFENRTKKTIALFLLSVMVSELICPNVALALTSGPTQPEVQGFEPVGTTDMVDMFSGDFNYNIPLMDVEGYPVNIAYHGGVNMEQEASWVGLGWNINPGVINRTVRGLPDDMKGDTLSKEFSMKDEKTFRVGIGLSTEEVGVGDPKMSLGASLGAFVTYNNYRGSSTDFDLGVGLNLFNSISLGVNIGVGSSTGASIDYNANLSVSSASVASNGLAAGVGVGVSQGYCTRTGLKDLNFSYSVSAPGGGSSTITKSVPIGIQNYVPVITNTSVMKSVFGRIKDGGEAFWCLGYGNLSGLYSKLHYNDDGSRACYGYLYLQDAKPLTSILDFTRDKDGEFNKSMQYLPPANLTYDIYSVSGQGTGGVFRSFRNDFGAVYDPMTMPTTISSDLSFQIEGGEGDILEFGIDVGTTSTFPLSGGFPFKLFASNRSGSIFEASYMKQAGELTEVDPGYYSQIGGKEPVTPDDISSWGDTKVNSSGKRDPRGNLIYYYTAEQASIPGVGVSPDIVDYTSAGFSGGSVPTTSTISRIGSNKLEHKKDEISEIVQVQKDGKKYIYGLPALNHVQKEVMLSVNTPSDGDKSQGLASFSTSFDDGKTNRNGREHYYSNTITPSFVHSYLLSTVESADYMDVTGNGPSDDDIGSYTKFNYSLKEPDYRWRAPYESGKAQYNPGFLSDKYDDKGVYISGSREEWMLHSIETKNFVAEFYTSQRNDACGSTDPIVERGCYNLSPYNGSSAKARSYKLDSIKLYNKHDRFINKTNAVPVKTVYLVYTDDLCKGIPNVVSGLGTSGKLTLSKIYFKYGNSQKSMISPYQFSYGFNPNYDLAAKDRWGCYKPNTGPMNNYESPFVDQTDTALNTYASAWSLTGITLPSGGRIQANYESDDYAFVQDKPADEMFRIAGTGFTDDLILKPRMGKAERFPSMGLLYINKLFPFQYIYFKRRIASEIRGLSLKENYLNGDLLYFNFNVQLNKEDGNSYEQIKGYAKVVDIGMCATNRDYGYIQLEPVTPTGSDFPMNPISYTAMNYGRYHLPSVIFGSTMEPDDNLKGMLKGLKSAWGELIGLLHRKNILESLTEKNSCNFVKLDKSYIRLQNPGMCKKGGGQRVKSLLFYDSWNTLAGGSEQEATYGKVYDYTTVDSKYGKISSGVSSYEPLIGGDENPFREPVPYIGRSGSNWPPNDPVGLYQETPIGESLIPPGSVGYSKVKVSSIHKDVGKSSQGIDVYEFYTARDFPFEVKTTAINTQTKSKFEFFESDNELTASQGFSFVFNDMHGKPKSVEHMVHRPRGGADQMISYQIFKYKTVDNKLDNNVNCLVYDPSIRNMKVQNKQLGVEADVSIDSRFKNEKTSTSTFNFNLNCSFAGPIPVPVPYFFKWKSKHTHAFQSATVTKVVQQYGILDEVQSFNEGALTIQNNELYDPQTGQVVVSSVNNEFNDKEYTVNIPAYWGYIGMGPGYNNVKFETDLNISVDALRLGKFGGAAYFNIGDELLLEYEGNKVIAWFMGTDPVSGNSIGCTACCYGIIVPRFPLNTPGWTPSANISAHVTVLNSGAKNRLNETIETYTMMDNPIDVSGNLKRSLTNVISISAKTFSDSNTRIPYRFINNADTINPFAIGERGMWQPLSEYAYVTNRNYTGTTTRNSGLFNPTRLYSKDGVELTHCIQFPYNYMSPYTIDPNWRRARTVTKLSPNGKEVENIDAVGNYSSSVYGYNEELPVAVASNAKQGEVLADGFEDYNLLQYTQNQLDIMYSPFRSYFNTLLSLTPSSFLYKILKLNPPSTVNIVSAAAHTGNNCLSVPSAGSGHFDIGVPINYNSYGGKYNNYNMYFNNYPPYSIGHAMSAGSEYLPFKLNRSGKYVLSFWTRPASIPSNATSYTISNSCGIDIDGTLYGLTKKTNIIDGWQQVEAVFSVSSAASTATLKLPADFYVDDIRVFPSVSNMKAFVYNPVNEKLVSTLDENNFATIYEYDQEGNLVRVKKETEKGIMTVSESRSNNPKQ